MGKKAYCYFSASVFGLVGIAHLIRLGYHTPIHAGAREIPFGISWLGAGAALVLCLWGLASARK